MVKVDNITLASSGLENVNSLNITVSSELMNNHLPASPINPQGKIRVVYDINGQPMVFSIGTDDKLYLFQFKTASVGGYATINLMPAFPDYQCVRTFDVSQDHKGRISIVAALSKQNSHTATDVFIASKLTNDDQSAAWENPVTLFTKITALPARVSIDHITMGTSSDDNQPSIILTGSLDGEEQYFRIVNNAAEVHWLPENVTPENLQTLSLGFILGQPANYFLYREGDSQTLVAQSSLTLDYSPGQIQETDGFQYNCLATPAIDTSGKFTSDVFVGTDNGIILFKDGRPNNPQIFAQDIKDIHQIVVKEDGQKISLWVISSPNDVWYIQGTKGDTYLWSSPILFHENVIQIAPIRSWVKKTNELYLIDQEDNLIHFWQDPDSTLWHHQKIKVQQQDYLIDFPSFTTMITVEDQDGNAVQLTDFTLRSSEWVYVVANGLVYSLDKDTPAIIATDVLGHITIIQQTETISAPILSLSTDFLDQEINIHANGKIREGLSEIKQGTDLTNAKDQNGDPILDKQYEPGILTGIASNLTQLTTAAGNYMGHPDSNAYTFISITDKGVLADGKLNLDAISGQPNAIGLSLQNGQWTQHDGSGFIEGGSILDVFEGSIGDAFHFLDKAVSEGTTFLENGVSFIIKKADDALHMVVNLAGKVFNLVLDTIHLVFRGIKWLFKLIGVELLKFIKWLGFLFGWHDIWETHKVIAAMANHLLDYAIEFVDNKLEDLRNTVDGYFDHLIEQVDHLMGIAASTDLNSLQPRQAVAAVAAKHKKNPASHSMAYHLLHGGLFSMGSETVGSQVMGGDTATFGLVEDILEHTIIPAAKDIWPYIQDAGKQIFHIVKDHDYSADALLPLIHDLFMTIIDPIREISNGLIDCLEGLLNGIKETFEGDPGIPFLGAIYKFVTKLTGESEEELSIINGIALLLAVPTTIECKLISGKAPFGDSKHGLDQKDLFANLLGPVGQQHVGGSIASDDAWDAYSKYGGIIAGASGTLEAIFKLITSSFKLDKPAQSSKSSPVPEDSKFTKTFKKSSSQLRTNFPGTTSFVEGKLGALAVPGTFWLIKTATTIPPQGKDIPDSAWWVRVGGFIGCQLISLGAIPAALRDNNILDGVLISIEKVVGLTTNAVSDGLESASGTQWALNIIDGVAGLGEGIGLGLLEEVPEAGIPLLIVGLSVSFLLGIAKVVAAVAESSDESKPLAWN